MPAPYKSVPGDQYHDATDKVVINDTATTATAGGQGSLPATVRGYLIVVVNGVQKKIPYYDV